MAVDLLVDGIRCNQQLTPVARNTGVDISYTIYNAGTTAIPDSTSFEVTIYAAENLYGTATPLLKSTVSGLGALSNKSFTQHVDVPRTVDNDAYIFVGVDSQYQISELNESNNSYRGVGEDMLRYSAERDVTVPAGGVMPTALKLDGKYNIGTIGDEMLAAGDIDTYKVSLTAGKKYWFEMYEVSNNFNGAMRLVSPTYETLAVSTSDPVIRGQYGAYIEYTAPATGDYYLAISNDEHTTQAIYNLDGRDVGNPQNIGSFQLAGAEVDPPDVVVSSLDPSAVEGSLNDPNSAMEFTVTRQFVAQPDRPTTVKLQWSGQFSAGDLYGTLPTEITIPANEYKVTFKLYPVDDGINEPTETENLRILPDPAYHLIQPYDTQTFTILDNPVTHHPFMTDSAFIGLDHAGPRTYIRFSEDVSYSITKDDYTLKNLDTGAVIPADKLQVLWSPSINASIVYFTGYANGQLPDGNYRMMLNKSGVYTWPDGKQLADNVVIDFKSLRGDTNGDGAVDFTDLLAVAQHYGLPTPADSGANVGDFDRDNDLDFNDLLTLAQNYGKKLPTLAAAVSLPSQGTPAVVRGPERRRADFGELPIV